MAADIPILFRGFRCNENGELNMAGFCELMHAMKVRLSEERIDDLFQVFDTDGRGTISDRDFVHVLFPIQYREVFPYLSRIPARRICESDEFMPYAHGCASPSQETSDILSPHSV